MSKMKYEKPLVAIEHYKLDGNIAASCASKINAGPEHNGQAACSGWAGGGSESGTDTGANPFKALLRGAANEITNPKNINFYESCDCYYNAGKAGYFTS